MLTIEVRKQKEMKTGSPSGSNDKKTGGKFQRVDLKAITRKENNTV